MEVGVGLWVVGGLVPFPAFGAVTHFAFGLGSPEPEPASGQPGSAPRVLVEVGLLAPTRAFVGATETIGATFSAAMLSGQMCGALPTGEVVRVSLCGGVRGGWMTAGGFGFPRNHRVDRFFLGVVGAVHTTVRLFGGLSAFLRVDGMLQPLPERFTARAGDETLVVHTLEVGSLGAIAGLGWSVP
jgi:hypothetical protein